MTDIYRIIETSDDHECEVCGWSQATGYNVFKNGELVLELTPEANCYAGTSWLWEDLIQRLGNVLGVKVVVEGYEGPNNDE